MSYTLQQLPPGSPSPPGIVTCFLLGIYTSAGCWGHGPGLAPPNPPHPPALVVMVVVDQGRGDMLERLEPHLQTGGLDYFRRQGAWFENAHYSYLVTTTAPGHATLATGHFPSEHGIVGNTWREGQTEVVASVDARGVTGPGNLRVHGISDELKRLSPMSRVISLSLKARGAVLLGGESADNVYWFNGETPAFVGKTGGGSKPVWLNTFNSSGRIQRDLGAVWQPVLPVSFLENTAGPDNCVGETEGRGITRTFPHALNTGGGAPYPVTLVHSPFGNDLLLDFALAAIEGEGLGRDETPDLLTVSLSSADLVGHLYGQQSWEYLDMAARLDLALANFISQVQARVGEDRVGFVLAADHGGAWIPECAPPNAAAGRVYYHAVEQAAEDAITRELGPPPPGTKWVAAFDDPALYLNVPDGVDASRVKSLAREGLLKLPGMADACDPLTPSGPWEEACRRSAAPGRSPSLFLIPLPGYIFSEEVYHGMGTTHGTPHPYDSWILLSFVGPGIRPGLHPELVDPVSCAPTLLRWLGQDPSTLSPSPVLPVFIPTGR